LTRSVIRAAGQEDHAEFSRCTLGFVLSLGPALPWAFGDRDCVLLVLMDLCYPVLCGGGLSFKGRPWEPDSNDCTILGT